MPRCNSWGASVSRCGNPPNAEVACRADGSLLMSLSCLPPVGCAIRQAPYFADAQARVMSALGCQPGSDRTAYFYGSGTMALAESMRVAKQKATERGVTHPEVLLPAYGCPDLVSAALHADVRPVLVDLEPGSHRMNLAHVEKLLGPNTVAIVAVHFLGLVERLSELRALAESAQALLIEDSAQVFPVEPVDTVWQGDLVVLSFGRGKPVSLLGGGLVLCNRPELAGYLDTGEARPAHEGDAGRNQKNALTYHLKISLHNRLLSPVGYGLLLKLPGLNLGQTLYKPLMQINGMSVERLALLPANLAAFQERTRPQEGWLRELLAEFADEGVADLTKAKGARITGVPLLRYPLLVESAAVKERLLKAMNQAGLGASAMYPVSLPEIQGLDTTFKDQGPFPMAKSFAQRLMTLPCHEGVNSWHIDTMRQVLSKLAFR